MTTQKFILHRRLEYKHVYLLPLFIIAISFFFALSPQSAHAGTGYLTGNMDDFDGFLNGNPYQGSFPRFTTYGKLALNGYSGNLPSLCQPQNSTYPSNCSSNIYWSNGNHIFVPHVDTPVNGYDINGTEFVGPASATKIPDIWYGNKVVITLSLNFSELTQDDGTTQVYTHVPTAVEANWGAIEFINTGNTNTCNDLITSRMISVDGVTTNDFISFELDYTNVPKETVCNINPRWRYGGSEPHGYAWYNPSYKTIYMLNPYIGWDVVENNSDDLATTLDDWKEQQGEEFERELETIQNQGNTAQNTGNAILNVFNFAIADPMLGLFSLFVDTTCVNIPIIAGMINVNNSQVCSPWSVSVRSILTPVFTVGGTMLLWGFVINWLRNDGSMVEVSEYTTNFRRHN